MTIAVLGFSSLGFHFVSCMCRVTVSGVSVRTPQPVGLYFTLGYVACAWSSLLGVHMASTPATGDVRAALTVSNYDLQL